MDFLINAKDYFLDFIFPKAVELSSLESLSIPDLLNFLPAANPIKDDRAIVLFDYKNEIVRAIVWEIKYKGNRTLARKVAELIYEALCEDLAERSLFENFKNPILVPMPISAKRKRERGFNQIEIICEEIMKLDKNNLFEYKPGLIEKALHTESQTKTVSKKDRLLNIEGSMKISKVEELKSKCVVIVDDVITTGATINEARRALKEAGVRKILAISFAH